MRSLCLLVHDPFRVVFETWDIDDPEDATAAAVEALYICTDLQRLGATVSLTAFEDQDVVEICKHPTCMLRRAFLQEMLNDLRCRPGTPMKDMVSRN